MQGKGCKEAIVARKRHANSRKSGHGRADKLEARQERAWKTGGGEQAI